MSYTYTSSEFLEFGSDRYKETLEKFQNLKRYFDSVLDPLGEFQQKKTALHEYLTCEYRAKSWWYRQLFSFRDFLMNDDSVHSFDYITKKSDEHWVNSLNGQLELCLSMFAQNISFSIDATLLKTLLNTTLWSTNDPY